MCVSHVTTAVNSELHKPVFWKRVILQLSQAVQIGSRRLSRSVSELKLEVKGEQVVRVLKSGGPGLQVSKDTINVAWHDVPVVEDVLRIYLVILGGSGTLAGCVPVGSALVALSWLLPPRSSLGL
eukprot:1965857-Amphidinium_carterae.1